MNVAYIALGSNIEDRLVYLEGAISSLNEHNSICVKQVSSIYETEPVGYVNQANFLNMVIKIETTLLPNELLEVTSMIEQKYGRSREQKWGPRTLDLDILLYNEETVETEKLTIPHPRMMERSFVLVPLIEIKQEWLDKLPSQDGTHLWKKKEVNHV